MAGQDDTTRIIVEVVDKFSKPLNDLKKQFEGVGRDTSARKARDMFEGLRDSVATVGNSVRNVLAPALSAMGVSTLSAGGAIAAMAVAIRDFSKATNELSFLSRQTGLSVDKMREMESVGKRVGVSSEQMRGSLSNLARTAQEFRAGTGSAWNKVFQEGDANTKAFAQSLRHAGNNAEFLEGVFRGMDNMPRVVDKERWLEWFGMPKELALLTRAEREKVVAEWRKVYGPTTKEGEAAARKFEEVLNQIGDSWDGLTKRMAESGSLKELTGVAEKLRDLLNNPKTGEALVTVFKTLWSIAEGIFNFFKGIAPYLETANAAAENILRMYDLDKGAEQRKHWEDVAKQSTPMKRQLRWGGLLPGTEPVPLAKTTDELRKSLGGPSKEETKQTLKEGVAEGTIKGLKEFALEMGGGAMGGIEGGNLGGASVIKAALTTGGNYGGGAGGAMNYGGGGPTGKMPAGQRAKNAQVIYDTLRSLGHSHEQASAALAHVEAESSFNPNATGDRGTAHGFFQHRGVRWQNQLRKSREWGLDPNSPEAAARFFDWELRNDPGNAGPGVARRYFGSSTTRDAVTALNAYERFAGWQRGQAHRYGYGEKYARSMKRSEGQELSGVPMPPTRPIEPPTVPRERLMNAAAASNQFARVEGDARLRIDLNGFPRGTRTQFAASGMFSDVQLHRGDTVPFASESA